MDHNVPELLKTYSLSIKEGHHSSPIRLQDERGGDMFFTIYLAAVTDINDTGISFKVQDDFHADIKVEVMKDQYSSLSQPTKIGTFENEYELYLNVQAKPLGANDEHEIILSFYIKR